MEMLGCFKKNLTMFAHTCINISKDILKIAKQFLNNFHAPVSGCVSGTKQSGMYFSLLKFKNLGKYQYCHFSQTFLFLHAA